MINNRVFSGYHSPSPNRTDVCDQNNLCYIDDRVPNPVPAHIPENVAAGGELDDEYDLRERGSLMNTQPLSPILMLHIPTLHLVLIISMQVPLLEDIIL